jgi:hypothetical protein
MRKAKVKKVKSCMDCVFCHGSFYLRLCYARSRDGRKLPQYVEQELRPTWCPLPVTIIGPENGEQS